MPPISDQETQANETNDVPTSPQTFLTLTSTSANNHRLIEFDAMNIALSSWRRSSAAALHLHRRLVRTVNLRNQDAYCAVLTSLSSPRFAIALMIALAVDILDDSSLGTVFHVDSDRWTTIQQPIWAFLPLEAGMLPAHHDGCDYRSSIAEFSLSA